MFVSAQWIRTLSSYSHCILLINFLQRKNILPILQEKNELEAFARDEMFDGIHDVPPVIT